MSKDAPEELKGWPDSWYVKDNKGNVYLRCPAPKCKEVFRNAKQMDKRLEHQFMPEDEVTTFQHAILAAMCEVKHCPKCNTYKRTTRNLGPLKTDSDIRALLKHERDVHGSEDFTDMRKFVGFIREHRARLFGGKDLTRAARVWKIVDKYHHRSIKQQPEFQELEEYLVGCRVFLGNEDWLDRINKTCRDTVFPDNPQGAELAECRKYYPVAPGNFLRDFEPLERQPGRKHVWDIFRDKYAAGEI